MSAENEQINPEKEEEIEPNYQPPPQKTIEEIIAADQEDESLRKYKEALLGAAQSEKIVVGKQQWNSMVVGSVVRLYFFWHFAWAHFVADANDPRKVIVKKLALCVPDRDDMELDLTGDLTKLKTQVFTIKEGVHYRIRIDFIVQREIVHGLKYIQKTYRSIAQGNQKHHRS